MSCTGWGFNRETLKLLYNSFIKSKIDYGLQVYSSAADAQIQRLEVIQNSALKIITGLEQGTKFSSLQFESNYMSIRCYINLYCAKH